MTRRATMSSWKRAALRVAGSATILALLFAFLPFSDVVRALARVPLPVWGAALGTYLCLHLIGVIKWRMLIGAAGGTLPFAAAIRCYYGGLFGNTFLPSIVGGDIVRAGLALTLCRNRHAVVLGSLVDRALDMLGLGLVAGIGAILLPQHLDEQSRKIFIGLMLLFAAGGAALAIAWRMLPARRFPFRIRRRLVKLREVVDALRQQPRRVATALTLGMTLQILLTALNAWLGRSMGFDIAFAIWLFVWPLAKVSAVVPVTMGGIGIREAAQVALFVPFGVAAATALAVGLVFQAIVISGGLLGGLLAFLLGRAAPGRTPAATATTATARATREHRGDGNPLQGGPDARLRR